MNIKRKINCDQCEAAIRMLKPGGTLHCPHRHAVFSRNEYGGLTIRFANGYQPRGMVNVGLSTNLN